MFPNDQAAEKWFEAQRWPNGIWCPDCGSFNCAVVKSRKPMPCRCRDRRAHFSVRKGTAMQASKLGLQKWAFAFYIMTTGIKGMASMKVARDLGIPQKTAWFLMQRIREGFMAGARCRRSHSFIKHTQQCTKSTRHIDTRPCGDGCPR